MLLQNTNASARLVNGMAGSSEEITLDTEIPGTGRTIFTLSVASWLELDNQHVPCTAPLLCVLIRLAHDHALSFSGFPDAFVPIFPM
jgi:hypothetical protein